METKKNYIIISSVIFIISILFYAFYHEYLIINFKKQIITQKLEECSAKQKIVLHWHKSNWQTESIHLLLNQNVSHDAQLILGSWLETALDEQIFRKKINVQSVMASADERTLFVSFDHAPFSKESSIFEKWMIIEGMLKTISHALPSVKKIVFLVNHQTLLDTHLDFSNPWPIEGFSY